MKISRWRWEGTGVGSHGDSVGCQKEAANKPPHLGWGVAGSVPTQPPVRRYGRSAPGRPSGAGTGDSCLLSKGVQRSELLSSTTHQHNCCLLQITYRILEIRRRRSKGPYVPWLRKSCGELKERGEITFNTVWLKESHYPSTPPCPGAGVSPHSPSLAMATSRRGAPTARGGTGECKGARH